MKKGLLLFSMMSILVSAVQAQQSGNNSVYIDQTNADNSTITITQTGSGNEIGDRVAMVDPAFIIEGNNMDLTINQDGMNNIITGNFIGGDSTLSIDQTGSLNIFSLTQGNFGTNGGNWVANFTGDSNNVGITMGSTANTGNYIYNLNVTGNTNTLTSTMNSKYITNNITITGDTNTYTTTQTGFSGTNIVAGHKIDSTIIGDSNVLTVTQDGTNAANYATVNITGNNTTTTIVQH